MALFERLKRNTDINVSASQYNWLVNDDIIGVLSDWDCEIAPFARRLVESEQVLLFEKSIKKLEYFLQSRMSDRNSLEEKQLIQNILDKVTYDNIDIINTILADKTVSNELIFNILNSTKSAYRLNVFNPFLYPVSLPIAVLQNSGFMNEIKTRDSLKLKYLRKLLWNEKISKETIPGILEYLEKDNLNVLETALKAENFDFKYLSLILKSTLIDSWIYVNGTKKASKAHVKFAEFLINNPNFPTDCIADVVRYCNSGYMDEWFLKSLCNNIEYPPSQIASLIVNIWRKRNGNRNLFNSVQVRFKQNLAKRLVDDANCPNECIVDIIWAIDSHQKVLFENLYNDVSISKYEISSILTLEHRLSLWYKNLTFLGKCILLTDAVSIDENTLIYLKKYGIDKNEVDELVDKISLELGLKKESIYTTEENKKHLFENYIANNSINEKFIKDIDLNVYKDGIPLKYPRSEFIQHVDDVLRCLRLEDRAIVLNYFDLQITNGVMDGFPIIPEKPPVVKNELLPIIDQLKNMIVNFTQNNETLLADPESKQLFDSIIKGCPEFITVIGKTQHIMHQYTVDIHTFKVLQNAFNDPEYKKLDDESKTVLKFAILLHDIGKKEGVVDKLHYETSAKDAVSILEKYGLSARVKSRIIQTIYNHHRFQQYTKNEIDENMVNAIFRTPNDLRIWILLAKADLMGVGNNFHFKVTKTHTAKDFDEFFEKKKNELILQQHVRYRNSNLVVDTKFTQTDTRKFPTQIVNVKWKSYEVPVLNLTDDNLSWDLFEFWFAKWVNRKTARFFAHFNDRISGLKVFMALSSSPITESVQSLSMISFEHSRSYRDQKYGVIVDVDMANIAQASNVNISSGYKKDLKHFSKDLFESFRLNTFVRDCLVDELSKASITLTKEEYWKLAEEIVNIQYDTQITQDIKIGEKIIPAILLQNALNVSRDKLLGGSTHSEIIAINPRVKALVARVSSIEECSQEFLELAVKTKLPIILIWHNE